MVRRSRLLLRPGWVLLLTPGLTGCPAEQLGVELPKGGVDAISQEDLRRDAWLVEQAGGQREAAAAVAQRFGQMRMLPGFGSEWLRTLDLGEGKQGVVACGRKEGASEDVQLVVAVGEPGTAAGAVTWAGAVSLAKGWDERGVPKQSRVLCVAPSDTAVAALLVVAPLPQAALSDIVLVDALHGPALEERHDAMRDMALVRYAAPGPAPSELGAVDHRQVEQTVRAVVTRLGLQ